MVRNNIFPLRLYAMHRSIDNRQHNCSAFTLLEMILSVALTGLLALSAFALTNGAIQMGAEVSDDQRRTLEVQRCLEVFRSHIESLPGNTRFELLAEGSGAGRLLELRIYGAPEAFQVGGILARSDAVSIISEEIENEGVSLSLRYDTFVDRDESVDSRHLTLLSGLSKAVWRFYSPIEDDWVTEWEEVQGRPRFIELDLVLAENNDQIRTVFWLPPVANPKNVIAGMIKSNQQAQEGQLSQQPGTLPKSTGQPAQLPGASVQPRQSQGSNKNRRSSQNQNQNTNQNRRPN